MNPMTEEWWEQIPWLRAITNFENEIPVKKTPFVRTKHLNKKSDGCFICGRRYNITRHHIRKGWNPLGVFICRHHHDVLHGIGLDRKFKKGKKIGKYVYRDADLRMALAVAERYKLFKTNERGIISKAILMELDRRKSEQMNSE